MSPHAHRVRQPFQRQALVRLVSCFVIGGAGGLLAFALGHSAYAFSVGWTVAAAAYCLWTWLLVQGMDGAETREHASADDNGRIASEVVWVLAVLASLVGVGQLLIAGSKKDAHASADFVLGVMMVAASWFLVHLLFTLRYAHLYYSSPPLKNPPVDFNGCDEPDYHDFAYLAFCLGMTYQVSDTNIGSPLIRRTVTRHTLLSYLLGAVVLACTVNLVVQIASS